MRKWINLMEGLSDIAVEKTAMSLKSAIENKLSSDKIFGTNIALYNRIITRPDYIAAQFVKFITDEIDPSPKGIYTKWLLNRWLKGDFRFFEDLYKATNPLSLFDKAKPKLDIKDINQFKSFKGFEEYISKIEPEEVVSNREFERQYEQELINSGKAIVYYNSPDVKIIIPKSKEASCHFGKNTKWCTAAKNNNMFDTYAKDGDLYIIIFKKENKRWQFHFESMQFMDEQDEILSKEDIWKSPVYTILEKQFIEAVQQNGYVIEYINNPSEEAQKMAVQQYGWAIKYIDNPSEEVQKLAVQQYGYAITYIKNPSEEVQKLAVRQNGSAIEYINNPSEEAQKMAVQQNGTVIRYIDIPSEEVQKLAVQQDGWAIKYIDNPSEEVQKLAVQQYGYAITYIKNPSEEVQKLAVQEDGMAIQYIDIPSEEVQRLAVQQNGMAIKFIDNPSEEVRRLALSTSL